MDLRVPGFAEYLDAIELAFSKALAKQSSPQEALNECADTWKKLTERLGKDKQQAAYKVSMGIK